MGLLVTATMSAGPQLGTLDPMATNDLVALAQPLRQQCRARSKSTGDQCRRPAIPGGAVCIYHGGEAPQVKRAAERRLAQLAGLALDMFQDALRRPDVPWPQKVQVGKDILDRLGVGEDHRRPAPGSTSVQVSIAAGPELDALLTQAMQETASLAEAHRQRSVAMLAGPDTIDAEVVEDPVGPAEEGDDEEGALTYGPSERGDRPEPA